MSTAQMVHNKIAKFPVGHPFTVEMLKQPGQGNWKAVQRSLSRMTQSGELKRISKGIYTKPEILNGYTVVMTGKELIACIERTTHETVVTSGAQATNSLGITTQAQDLEMYYWTGRTKTITIGNKVIMLKYINKKFANKSHPLLELFLSAAYFLGKEMFTIRTIKLAEKTLGWVKISELMIYLPVMPTWVRKVFQQYFAGIEKEIKISDYPQLKFISWNRHTDEISLDEAFSLYKSNWRFIVQKNLTNKERRLIERLTRVYGELNV